MAELKYYIEALYQSLFSRRFYFDLTARKSMLGIKYILILAIIVSTPRAFEIKYIIARVFSPVPGESVEQNLNFIEAQIPPIYIRNGKFSIDASKNKEIMSTSGNLIAVFDVEDKINDLNDYNNILVINPETLRFKISDDETMVFMTNELSESLDKYFDEDGKGKKFNTEKFFFDLAQISKTPLLLIILFTVMGYFAKYLFSALLFSFVAGIFFVSICKRTIFDFRQCYRIAAFTLTPVALLETISNSLGGSIFSYTSLVYFITHLLYIHFALESYKKFNLMV
jgi:hypothetical protein